MDDKDRILLDDEDFLPMSPSEEKNEQQNSENISIDENIFSSQTEEIKKGNNIIKSLSYKNVRILPVIAFLFVSALGIYIFINNVNADIINLIKIEQKQKVGYINSDGNVIVKPKYLYGTDFYKGHAIVKNYNNLFGIINGKGNNDISFGNIFSAVQYSDRYIISKFTNEGLKMGLLDSNLKEVTRFKYDNLAYSDSGIFIFTENDKMGMMNKDGKELFSYKVDEIDDRNISLDVSKVTDKTVSNTYAKIKINESSTIINIKTGKEVYKYTLDDIRVLDNNVFYIKNEKGNNLYFVIKDDQVVFQTTDYKRVRVEDINSNIAIAIKEDTSIDYIDLLKKEVINKDENIKYTYSDGVILKKEYNHQASKDEYTIFTPNKVLGTFSDIKLEDGTFVNGFAKVITDDNKYNFINKNGQIISKSNYDEVSDFNDNNYAIVSNDNLYGLIDSNGREILKVNYEDIIFLDSDLFDSIYKKTNEKLFIFKDNNKYGIINSNGKVMIKPIYNSFDIVTTKYPIISGEYNGEKILVNLQTFKDLSIDSSNVEIYEDYIISDNDYYNYSGDLIYNAGG